MTIIVAIGNYKRNTVDSTFNEQTVRPDSNDKSAITESDENNIDELKRNSVESSSLLISADPLTALFEFKRIYWRFKHCQNEINTSFEGNKEIEDIEETASLTIGKKATNDDDESYTHSSTHDNNKQEVAQFAIMNDAESPLDIEKKNTELATNSQIEDNSFNGNFSGENLSFEVETNLFF